MSFDPIGPYEFRRSDLVAASLAIGFVVGSRSTRWRMMILAAAGAIVVIGTIVSGDYWITAATVFIVLWLFIGGPALRSRKRSRNVFLSYDAEGLIAETDDVRTIYKWATIGRHQKIGSRLFIMISDAMALVVADRFTDPVNMTRLLATLDQHRGNESGGGDST